MFEDSKHNKWIIKKIHTNNKPKKLIIVGKSLIVNDIIHVLLRMIYG